MHDSPNQLHIVFWILGDTKLINPIDLFSIPCRPILPVVDIGIEILALRYHGKT
jgi:hypothetical protein